MSKQANSSLYFLPEWVFFGQCIQLGVDDFLWVKAENAQMSKKAFSVRGRNFYKEQWVVASNLIYPRLHQCVGMLCEQNEVATISRSISFFRVSVA